MSKTGQTTRKIFQFFFPPAPFVTQPGIPYPLGAHSTSNGINFSVFAPHIQTLELALFLHQEDEEPYSYIAFDPEKNRSGDIWHIEIVTPKKDWFYAWCCDKESSVKTVFLVDPYAKVLSGLFPWGKAEPEKNLAQLPPTFERPSQILSPFQPKPVSESIFYEVQLRSFTAHSSAKASYPGTFKAFHQKIPYLKSLGITAVEFLPLTEFDENEVYFQNPNGEPLRNLWGYSPLSFFAPKSGFASQENATEELRELVEALHQAGIEVIVDVVFNHTSEGEEKVQSFRGFAPDVYYIQNAEGKSLNLTGCGNTVKCQHPVVRRLIVDSLRYWVQQFGVDGFRFDLATILARDEQGHMIPYPPLLDEIARDPLLSKTKLIAEAWDAAGGYQLGHFGPPRFSEWNDRFRDDVRLFWREDSDKTKALSLRILGSPDVYKTHHRQPINSINFVTCHDGFTLKDLVSFETKHNEANGEMNRDGNSSNCSSNHGVEGPTSDVQILKLRESKRRALMATLFLSQGVPLLLGGDEFGRTQQGNNNAYCQDNEISWWNWDFLESPEEQDFFKWVQFLIQFRKNHLLLRQEHFLEESKEYAFFDGKGEAHSFEPSSKTLGVLLYGKSLELPDLYMVFHNEKEGCDHPLPEGSFWFLQTDSFLFSSDWQASKEEWKKYKVEPHSVVVFESRSASS